MFLFTFVRFVKYGVTDMNSELVPGFDAKMYREFLDAHANHDDWSYYKVKLKTPESDAYV